MRREQTELTYCMFMDRTTVKVSRKYALIQHQLIEEATSILYCIVQDCND